MKKSIVSSLVTGMATVAFLMGTPSGSQAQKFVDVSETAGIDGASLNKSWGSPVWGDVNNDGFLEVMVSTHGVNGQRPFIYLNNGNGTFTNIAATCGIAPTSAHDPVNPDSKDWHGWAIGDLEGDGKLD